MCVLYMSFGSKVRPRICGCFAIRSAVLFICMSRLNRVHVVLSGFSVRFVLSRQKLYVGMVVCISLLHPCDELNNCAWVPTTPACT